MLPVSSSNGTLNGTSDHSENLSNGHSSHSHQEYDPVLLSLLPQLQTVLPENQSDGESITQLTIAIADIISGSILNQSEFLQSINQSVNQSEDALDCSILVQLITMKYAESLQRIRFSFNHSIDRTINQDASQLSDSANDISKLSQSSINQSSPQTNHQFVCDFLSFLSLTPHFLTTRSFNQLISQSIKQYGLYFLFDKATSTNHPIKQSSFQSDQQVRNCLTFAATYGLHLINQSNDQTINRSSKPNNESINQPVNQPISLIIQRGFSHLLFDFPAGSICFRTLRPINQIELLIVQLINPSSNPSTNQSSNQSNNQSHILALLQALTEQLINQSFDDSISLQALYKLAFVTDPDQAIFNRSNNQSSNPSGNKPINQPISPYQSVDSHSRIVLMELHLRTLIEISKRTNDQSMDEMRDQPINSSRNHSSSQPINLPDSQSTSQSRRYSISQSPSHSNSKSISRSNSRSVKMPDINSFRQNSILSFYGSGEEIEQSQNPNITQSISHTINESSDDDDDDTDDFYSRSQLINQSINQSINYRIWLILAACIDAKDWLLAASINQSINQPINQCECMLSYYESINQFTLEQALGLIDQSVKEIESVTQQARLLLLIINRLIKQSSVQSINQLNHQSINQIIAELEQALIDRMDWIAPSLRLALNDNSINQPIDRSTPPNNQSIFTSALHLSLAAHRLRVLHDHSINQSNNQSINQSIKQHFRMTSEILSKLTVNHQPRVAIIDHSVNQSNNQLSKPSSQSSTPTHRSNKQSISQPINQSIKRSVFFTCGHSFTESQFSVALSQMYSKLNQSVNQTNNQSNNQSINQPLPITAQYILNSYQSINQSIKHSNTHSINNACPDCAMQEIALEKLNICQSIKQPSKPPIKQSSSQSIIQTLKQSNNQSNNLSNNPTIKQSINQPIRQSINQTIKQSNKSASTL